MFRRKYTGIKYIMIKNLNNSQAVLIYINIKNTNTKKKMNTYKSTVPSYAFEIGL